LNRHANLLLLNARVITLDPRLPAATAVAVAGNRILQAGSRQELEPLRETATRLIDCQGKTVVPGFNDAHCHPLALATSLLSVDCSPASAGSIGDIQARIRQRATEAPPGKWIRATGYNDFYLAEKRHPNRWDLDEAAPNHPVKLSHRSGHACVLNGLALRMLNIDRYTPEPPGGIIERDLDSGEPNGLIFEMNTYVDEHMPLLSEEELLQGMRLANAQFLSHGITSIQDATWTDSPKRQQMLQRFKEQGELSPRVSMMIGVDEIDEFKQQGLRTGSELGTGVRLGAVKIIIQTATGSLCPTQDELNMQVLKAHQAGFQVALHAIEENEVEAAITALEYALSESPKTDHRHRVEHCSVCPPHLLRRLTDIRAVVATQPSFIYYGGERYLATVPPKDLEWLYPCGSLMRNGLRVAASSDAPVVPVDPPAGIYAAVTRKAANGRTLMPREGVSRQEALEMHTANGAYASFEDGTKGCISPSALADLIVLSEDPTQVTEDRLREIKVEMTVVGGEILWQR